MEDDPPLYTVREMYGRVFIWLTVKRNVGWYWPEIVDGELVGLRLMGYTPLPGETPEQARSLNWNFKWIGPQQKRRIETAMAEFRLAVG